MNKQYIFWTAVLLVLVAVLTVWQSDTENQAPIAIKIGYREHTAYLPLFVGIEEGIFEKHNVSVEPVVFQSTNQLMEALLAGRIDAALGGVNSFLLITLEEKSPDTFKIFSSMNESDVYPAGHIIVSVGSDISSLRDLSGKRVGAFLGSTAKLMYESIVEANNLTGTELVQMEPKLELSALEAGSIDAAIVLEPLATIGQEKRISRSLESSIYHNYVIQDAPVSGSVVSVEFMNLHPSQTRLLVEATEEAIAYLNNPHNVANVRSAIVAYTTLDEHIAAALPLVPHQTLKDINVSKLQELADWMFERGEVETSVDASEMILHLRQ